MAPKYGSSNVKFMRVDVASHSNFEMAFRECFESFGTIDVLVNNAGTNAETSWETQVQINLMVSDVWHYTRVISKVQSSVYVLCTIHRGP